MGTATEIALILLLLIVGVMGAADTGTRTGKPYDMLDSYLALDS